MATLSQELLEAAAEAIKKVQFVTHVEVPKTDRFIKVRTRYGTYRLTLTTIEDS